MVPTCALVEIFFKSLSHRDVAKWKVESWIHPELGFFQDIMIVRQQSKIQSYWEK